MFFWDFWRLQKIKFAFFESFKISKTYFEFFKNLELRGPFGGLGLPRVHQYEKSFIMMNHHFRAISKKLKNRKEKSFPFFDFFDLAQKRWFINMRRVPHWWIIILTENQNFYNYFGSNCAKIINFKLERIFPNFKQVIHSILTKTRLFNFFLRILLKSNN